MIKTVCYIMVFINSLLISFGSAATTFFLANMIR